MRFPTIFGVIACLISAVVIPLPPLRASIGDQRLPALSSASIASTHVTVIDVLTGAHRTNVSVLIRDGRIDAIAPAISIPTDATRLDGKGKFLIPGLWDMHTHHQGTGAEWVDLFVAKGIVGTRAITSSAP
jgi:adenine deaminase